MSEAGCTPQLRRIPRCECDRASERQDRSHDINRQGDRGQIFRRRISSDDRVFRAPLKYGPELQLGIMQLAREGLRRQACAYFQAKLSRNSN